MVSFWRRLTRHVFRRFLSPPFARYMRAAMPHEISRTGFFASFRALDLRFLGTTAAQTMGLLALKYVGRRRVLAQERIDDAHLAEIRWAIPETALVDRTELGIELLTGGLRFVEPSAKQNVLKLPSTTPILVEASWIAVGETHTALLEASSGKQYDLWSDVNQVVIRTLAGEEYSLETLKGKSKLQRTPTRYLCATLSWVSERKSISRPAGRSISTPATTALSSPPSSVPATNVSGPTKSARARSTCRCTNCSSARSLSSWTFRRRILNAVFELGVRYGLKPRTTIIIAESKFTIPFDATHIRVFPYQHLGPSIDYDEAIRMQTQLAGLINAAKTTGDADSPVYVILSDLVPPTTNASGPPRKTAFTYPVETENSPTPPRPTCFVEMGFGKKIDFATGREINLDASYKSIIKPAVQAAGYQCIRADEVQQPGMIDVPIYSLLFGAELVVVDLSTANFRAVFALGVRYALRRRATIVIAESKFNIPFDAIHIAVRRYEHLGSSIDYDEAIRMQEVLTTLIAAIQGNQDPDSPVYITMPDLSAPFDLSAIHGVQAGLRSGRAMIVTRMVVTPAQLQIASEAMEAGEFDFAKKKLRDIYHAQIATGADGKPKAAQPSVVQQLALATYKAGEAEARTPRPRQALAGIAEAEALLRQLDVDTTTDPETLGLWSMLHKRRAEISTRSPDEQKQDLDEAIVAAQRAFSVKRDYFNGSLLAYLLNLRASKATGESRLADNIVAQQVRREVVDITARSLAALSQTSIDKQNTTLREERYWTAASSCRSANRSRRQIGREAASRSYGGCTRVDV